MHPHYKAQGQTIPHVGIYLPEPVFFQGQLYVALSRGVSRETWVLAKRNIAIDPTGKLTKNIVFFLKSVRSTSASFKKKVRHPALVGAERGWAASAPAGSSRTLYIGMFWTHDDHPEWFKKR